MNSFFAMMSRMKYIDRWALMRNSRQENLSEHSLEVSMIAHALAVIGNTCLGKQLDARKAAVLGLYHDATEIITGDMPRPTGRFLRSRRRTPTSGSWSRRQTSFPPISNASRRSRRATGNFSARRRWLWKQ